MVLVEVRPLQILSHFEKGMEMINAVKYIRKLEQAGFPRDQAEIQVQLVLEVIEGELVTKHDLLATEQRLDYRIDDLIKNIDRRFEDFENRMDHRFTQFEYRIVTKMSVIIVSTMTLFVAILGFIIKL